jgi:dihydroflavonol-4-reductase
MDFVTGGTGLLGSHLLFRLTNEKTAIKAIYRKSHKKEFVKQLFTYYDPDNGIERFNCITWVEGDVLDVVGLEDAMQGCDRVYHCAATVSFHKADFQKMFKTNREGTANVVNVALGLGLKKLCYVSSTAAIGGIDQFITEDSKWKQMPHTSGYSIAKYSAEKEVWRGMAEGLDAVIVNPAVIFGAGNWNESSLTIFNAISNGLKFYTAGANGFVDARDVSDIMVQLMQSEIKSQRFLCVSENTTFKWVFDRIAYHSFKKGPRIMVRPWLMGLAWRLAWLGGKISGIKPTITQETARSAFGVKSYSNKKVSEKLNFNFRPLDETIENAVKGQLV